MSQVILKAVYSKFAPINFGGLSPYEQEIN